MRQLATVLLCCALSWILPAYAFAAEPPHVWFDKEMQPVAETDAEYYLADHAPKTEDGEPGTYIVTVYYAAEQSPRITAEVSSLDLSNTTYVGDYKMYYRSGELLETGSYNQDGRRQGMVTVYDKEGQPKREMPYENGSLTGVYRSYYQGDLIREKEVKNDRRHGVNTTYFASGGKRRQVNFIDGDRDGLEQEWNEDGELVKEAHYKNDKLDGKLTRYFDDKGEVRESGEYDKGQPIGEHVVYYQPGQAQNVRNYNDDGRLIEEQRYNEQGESTYSKTWIDTEHGPAEEIREYHDNGELRRLRQETIADQSSTNWRFVERYNEAGDVIEHYEYFDGRAEGEFVRQQWGPGQEYGSFKDGELHGDFRKVDENGEILEEGTYDNGVKVGRWQEQIGDNVAVNHYNAAGELDGELTQHDAEGNLVERKHYADGVTHGPYESYDDEQRLRAKGEFVQGKRHGDWYITIGWSPYEIHEGRYDMDKQVGKWTEKNMHGHLIGISQFNDEGQRHGRQLDFEYNGALEFMSEYVNGEMHGTSVQYRNGKPDYEVRYENGRMLDTGQGD